MKCYNCDSPTITLYWNGGVIISDFTSKITHVNKACTVCPWMSYRTKVPGKLPSKVI